MVPFNGCGGICPQCSRRKAKEAALISFSFPRSTHAYAVAAEPFEDMVELQHPMLQIGARHCGWRNAVLGCQGL
jgi:hypothetical protein